MKITNNFNSVEFKCKDGTPYPEKWVSSRLKPLCEQLEIIRGHFQAPITITSGYRTFEHNKKIGGAKASQHVNGRAADFTVQGYNAIDVHEKVLKLYGDGLLKIKGLGLYPGWLHIDLRPGNHLVRWTGSRAGSG